MFVEKKRSMQFRFYPILPPGIDYFWTAMLRAGANAELGFSDSPHGVSGTRGSPNANAADGMQGTER